MSPGPTPQTEMITAWVSHYGYEDGFDGKRMANGKIFQANDSSVVAHKELPFGTSVRFTNLETGRQVTCIVQDRGPYVGKREYDLSYAAALKLGIAKKGVAEVRVQVIR